MTTDVILDDKNGNYLTLMADVVQSTATDFILAHPARRISDGPRRALVHNLDDGLTINFNDDYPGGISLNSVAFISPLATTREEEPPGVFKKHLRRVPELKIHGRISFTWDTNSDLKLKKDPEKNVDLQDIIEELQAEINTLKERITALGG